MDVQHKGASKAMPPRIGAYRRCFFGLGLSGRFYLHGGIGTPWCRCGGRTRDFGLHERSCDYSIDPDCRLIF